MDQDGFLLADDCNDTDSAINPNETEHPYNGIDDDCDPTTFDDDLDQDGFLLADDCNDTDPAINPNATEIADNGIDENCDGMDLVLSAHELANTTINIYPNPAFYIINIEIDNPLNFKASLYDLEGRLIKAETNVNQLLIDLVPIGIYLLEIKDLKTGQSITEKIVIER